VTKYLKRHNLKVERFILAHGFSTWPLGSIFSGPVVRQSIMAVYLMAFRKQREGE
jgi:hypothetical protein